MASHSTAISATDPRLTEDILKARIHSPLKSPQAIRLNQLPRVWRKAITCDDCGRAAIMLKDQLGHTWRQVFHCGQRYCADCAIIRAEKMIERFSSVMADAMREHPEIHKFRFIVAKRVLDAPLSPSDLDTFNADIAAGIKSLASAGSLFQTFIWPETRTLEARVLVLGEYDISLLLAAFPATTLRATTYPIGQWHRQIRELLAPDLPRSPEARAEAEFIADESRLFRATGAFYNRKVQEDLDADPDLQVIAESCDLVTEEENPTVNKSPKSRFSRCPNCNLPAVAVSESFPMSEPIPHPDHLRWKLLD